MLVLVSCVKMYKPLGLSVFVTDVLSLICFNKISARLSKNKDVVRGFMAITKMH